MRNGIRFFLVLTYLGNSAAFASGGVTSVNTSLDQVVESPRWMFDPKAKVKGGPLIDLMVEAKKALLAKDRAHCLTALQKSFALGKSLGPWLVVNQLQCASLPDKKGDLSVDALSAALGKVDAQLSWMLIGPAAQMIKVAYVHALLLLAERQTKLDRRMAWKTMDRLHQIRPWLNTEERANVYRWAGELAFVEQNLLIAQDFLQRSLSEKENAELRVRVQSIRATLQADKPAAAAKSKPVVAQKTVAPSDDANDQDPEGDKMPAIPPGQADKPSEKTEKLADITGPPKIAAKPNPDLGMTDAERDIYVRMTRSYESHDFLSAIEDGVDLIVKFPGSRRSLEAADRVLEIYLSVASSTDEKFRHVRERAVKEMQKADAGRLARWATTAYARGNYMDALNLAETAYSKYDGHPDSTKILLLAGRAAQASGEYADAIEHYETLLKRAGGTPEALDATFRLALLLFRGKKYSESSSLFERLLALGGSKDFEYRALYWQWRARQKMSKDSAAVYAEPLISKYPLSYYGLRAKAELNDGNLLVGNKAVPVKVEFRFLDSERLAWERLNILLKAGWLKEAEKELETLPEAQSPEERLVKAKLWASTLRYDYAVQNMNKALEEKPALEQLPILKIVYPKEYTRSVARESKALNLPEDWIRSLMRQESTFRPDAKSSSNALGLMQLLPATAGDMVKDLKLKDYQAPESLFDPDINIRLGSLYLSRMVHNFNGNVPLALAAYNAGPTRLRRWLAANKDLATLENSSSSAPEVELWIDELPWEETSFYVKAILRNWLIYRLLDESKVTLTEPIWLDAKAAAR